MQLQFSNEADVPQDAKDSFVPFEQDGATVFMHKDLAEQKKETYRNKGQLTTLESKLKNIESSMLEQQQQAVALAEAKALDDYNAKVAELKEQGKHSEVNKLEMEMQKAEHQKTLDALTAKDNELNELRSSITDAKKSELAIKIAQSYADPRFAEITADLIKSRIVEVDGVIAMTDSNGAAVAADLEAIGDMLKGEVRFEALAKAPASAKGVGAQGGQTNAGGTLDLSKPYDKMTLQEKVAFNKKQKQ